MCSFLVSEWLVKPVSAVIATNLAGAAAVVQSLPPSARHRRSRADRLGCCRDLAAERLQRVDVDLREHRERLDRVGEDVEWDVGADRERRLLQPSLLLEPRQARPPNPALLAAMSGQLPQPRLRKVYRLEATLGAPLDLGVLAQGHWRIVPQTGGTFPGPELNGTLLPGASADWQILLPDGTALGEYASRGSTGKCRLSGRDQNADSRREPLRKDGRVAPSVGLARSRMWSVESSISSRRLS